jgi:hypothetical protein
MQALPAITLSENQPQHVSLPIGVTALQLHNASVGFLTVNISGDSTYVGPQSWVTIPVGGQTASMELTLLDASAGSVYATVFMATDGDLANTLVSGSLNQQQVTVDSGTVDLASGASVAIAGTPTVDFAAGATVAIGNTPTVAISGTPTIVIQSGSVNINGGQLKNSVSVALQPTSDQLLSSDLGDGSAGAVIFGAGYTALTGDLQATSITVPSGSILGSVGYRIRCQGTCVVNGKIENSARASSGTAIGAPGATGTLIGGAIGVSAYGASKNGLSPVSTTLEGGSGGYGGTASASGGTTSASIASPTITTLHTGTLSGGASGGATSDTELLAVSGSGGGVVLILCTEIAGSGQIHAFGGNAYADSGNAYAGGGGGGLAIVACYTNNFTGIIAVAGGSGAGSYASIGDSGTAVIMVTT